MYAVLSRLLLSGLLLTTGCALSALAQEKKLAPNQHEEQEDEVRAREDWFYKQRAFPLARIPPGARLRAFREFEDMRRREGRIAVEAVNVAPTPDQPITASTTQWTSIGPQPTIYSSLSTYLTSGRISAMAVDPRNSSVVYLGGAQGGVWKTTDGGATWTALTDTQPSLAIGSIALAPSNPDTVYVGTGEANFSGDSYYGAGILKSTDGGQTWTQLPGNTSSTSTGSFVGPFSSGTGGARIGALAVHPQNPQIVFAGVRVFTTDSTAGIYRSTDGGVNWTNVRPGAAGTGVVFDVLNPQNIYGALGNPSSSSDPDNGVYRSADGGSTWVRLSGTAPNTFPTANVGRIELAIAPSTTGASATLYAAIYDTSTSGSLLGMWKTSDAGVNWAKLTATPDFCTPQCWYDIVVRVHPANPNVVFAGGAANSNHLIRSIDGGFSWSSVRIGTNSILVHVDQHAMDFSAGGAKLYLGNDGGAWSTTDTAASATSVNWTNLNSTLSLTQFYPGHSIHPSDEQIGIGGTQDNGTQKYTGTLAWEDVACGDGGWTAIDTAIPSTYYTTCQRISLWKSNQNGNPGTWSSILNGINTADRGAFIPPFVIDKSLPNRLYFGTFRVYQTTDGAALWTPISPDLTAGSGVLTAISVAPSNSNVVYAGATSATVRVQMTANAGSGTAATWTDVSVGLPPRAVTQIAVDPFDAATAIVTFSGFSGFLSGDTQGHVFRTTNSGVTWTDISGNLPNVPVNDVVIDPDVPNTYYVATDVAVLSTADSGVTWSTMVTGLPRVAVLSLKLHQPSRTLRAATHGRGLWDLKLSNFTPAFRLSSISPSSAAAGAAGFTLTAKGFGFSANSVIRWNGVDLATTFDSVTQQLTANVAAADLANSAAVQVLVFDAGQSPSTSNAMVFTILSPAPSLTSIAPTSAVAGSAAFTLTVNGANFISGATVRWNGTNRPTTVVSSTQVTADIPSSDLIQAGFPRVSVFVSPPGGGASSSQTFTVSTTTPPPNDNFANATVAITSSFNDTVNTFAATTETTDPTPSCAISSSNPRAKSIWYRFTPSASGTATVDTVGSVYDTILSVFTGNPPSLVPFACDDDSGGNFTSRVTLAVTANTAYYFMVTSFTNFTNESGQAFFNLTSTAGVANDYTIVANPSSATINAGQSATATLTLTPVPPPFATAIVLSCSSLPPLSSCSFSPPSVTPGAGTVTSTLTLTTTAPGTANPGAASSAPAETDSRFAVILSAAKNPSVVSAAGWIALLGALALFVLGAGKQKRKLRMGFYAGCVVLLAVFAEACGGGGGSSPPPPKLGTNPGTYTVTVTGTAGAFVRS
ncbi:MAG: hypothetical protein M1451_01415, partial [Acidobacteria bacterium]|nr:hypothetical protein [Acidobacteriota bacterium]